MFTLLLVEYPSQSHRTFAMRQITHSCGITHGVVAQVILQEGGETKLNPLLKSLAETERDTVFQRCETYTVIHRPLVIAVFLKTVDPLHLHPINIYIGGII